MIPTDTRATKKQQQGEQSRELILDATERLMATRGYAATSISDIRKACGLPPSSIYWHFGSKEGVLAAVMERGADRFFAAIPTSEDAEEQLAVLSRLQAQHPDFLRLFYMLSLERSDDPAVAAVVRRVRDTAIGRFRSAITQLLPADAPPSKADRVVAELTALAVAALGRGVLRRPPRTRYRRRANVPAAVAGHGRAHSDSVGGEVNMRTAIITGASSGLGLECARALLRSDPSWHLVLPVRDAGRGAEAVTQLGQPQRCTVMPMDLASLASVRAFVENVRAAGLPPLHAIVCNAGVQVVSGTEWTEDGVEMTFGVNHLGHFTLVQGLLDELAHPARIVVVSSGTHDPTKHTGMPDPSYTSAADLAHPRAEQSSETAAAATPPPSCATCSSPTSSTAGSATAARA